MMDLVIQGGLIVTAAKSYRGSIGIRNGKIDTIVSPDTKLPGKKVVSADGLMVMPGLIDMHVHFLSPFMGQMGAADFYSGTVAAAVGGVTTILDFTNTAIGQSMLDSVREKDDQARSRAVIDYSFHPRIVEAPTRIIDEIKHLVEYGVPTFKMFMTYRKQGVQAHDGILLKVLEEARRWNALPGVHAENNDIVESFIDDAVAAGRTDWHAHARTRPPISEEEAIHRAIYFAKRVNCPIFIYHVSTQGGMEAIAQAQKEGHPVYAETCSHYLSLTEDMLKRDDGYKYICSPPLRSAEHVEAMWDGLSRGVLSVTGSDDCNYSADAKKAPLQTDREGNLVPEFHKVVNGLTGMESRFDVLVSYGVNGGTLTWNDLVRVTSYNAARLFGLYPQKGDIQIGFDADLILVDPEKEKISTYDQLHLDTQYNPWEGMKSKGSVVSTYVRGEAVIENGQVTAQAGTGKFVHRKLDPAYLRSFQRL